MVSGPSGVPAVLLAVCEGTSVGEQLVGVAMALVGLVVWLGTIWWIVGFEREPDERRALVAVFAVSALVGAAVMLTLHLGLAPLILLALAAAGAAGLGGAVLSDRIGVFRAISAATVGSLSLPIGVVLLLILHVSVGGGCLGDELG